MGVGAALVAVSLGFVVRFLWYGAMTDPAWALPAELLHGVTFALAWAAATQYVTKLLPPELASTGQGLLAAVNFGLAGAAGSAAGGAVVDAFGWRVMWRAGAALGALATGVMAASLAAEARVSRAAAAKARAVALA